MKSVFFYGLFMDKSLLANKGFNPSEAIIAYVNDFGLRIGERATLIKSSGERVYGVVMSLGENELDELYSEGSVKDYLPVDLVAYNQDNEQIKAVAYNLPASHLKGKNRKYAESLVEVATKIGLPVNYVNEIKRWSV